MGVGRLVRDDPGVLGTTGALEVYWLLLESEAMVAV